MNVFADSAARLSRLASSQTHVSVWHRRAWAVANLPVVAAAIVWRRICRRTVVIAISGSRGKTTARMLLTGILAPRFQIVSSTRNQNGRFGVPQTVLSITKETEFAIVEIGVDGPGLMWRAAVMVKPDIAVLTSVAMAHSENFLNLEAVAAEKGRLVASLPATGLAVLNVDDPCVASMAGRSRAPVATYGQSPEAMLRADSVRGVWPERLEFRLTSKGESYEVSTRLVGTHWLPSVLAALSASEACGVALREAIDAISRIEPFPARLQPVRLACGAVMLRDEYNGSVGTLTAALDVMEAARAARKIAILSDFTDDPRPAAERLGDIARRVAQFADVIVFVGENCRIGVESAIAAGKSRDQVSGFSTIAECAAYLKKELREGDLALLKGRNGDHLSRIYWRLLGPVACDKSRCSFRTLCDACAELHGAPPADS